MKKKLIGMVAVAAAMLTTGCSNDITDNSGVDNTGKEKILFSAGDDQPVVRSRAGFENTTRIVARIVSESRGSEAAKSFKTVLSAQSGANFSKVAYAADSYVRYWDDAHGRNSILSVYAVAVPNKDSYTEESVTKYFIGENDLKGSSTDDTNITWAVSATQTTEKLANEDLAYSNNIQEGNVGGNSVYTWDYSTKAYPEENPDNAIKHSYGTDPVVTDGRLYFTQEGKDVNAELTDAAGHFDRGQMEFRHALSRIQVNLIKGDGYSASSPFNVTDMQVLGQVLSGTLNIKTATWSDPIAATAINMAKRTSAATRTDGKTNAATYDAQMLPGYVFAANGTNALQLTVDNNTYYITNQMLNTALGTNEKTMAIGTRYIFDITVAKNKIQNITATIVPWNEVTAANTEVDNSHATFTFYGSNTTGNKCTDVKLWKYAQSLTDITIGGSYTTAPAVANTVYSEVAGFQQIDETSTYTTSEYYNDNKTAYHFRSTNATTVLDASAKTFTMTSGNTDYHWGAPMKEGLTSDKLPYSLTDGYLSSIEKGIVAASTETNINLTEVHMTSQVVVKLTSIPSQVDKSDNAKVTLAGATVKFTKLSKKGTVDMGSGLITPASSTDGADAFGESSTLTVAKEGETEVYSCTLNVIPQALVRGDGESDDDYIGITIHTTDNNEYYIVKRLSEIIATNVGSEITNMQETGTGKYITRWYPGHKYIYTFNITKTKIQNITATIVNWNDVIGANTDLDLEK